MATGRHGTSLLISPWIPDFNVPSGLHPSQGEELKGFHWCVSLSSAKLSLSLKPAVWSVRGVSSSKAVSCIWRRMGQRKLAVIH